MTDSTMSTRLTNYSRGLIRNHLIDGKFDDRWVALVPRHAALALAVYNSHYPKQIAAEMRAMPHGWLSEDTSVSVQFGEGSSAYTHLNFSGEFYGLPPSIKAKLKLKDIKLRIQDQHSHGTFAKFERKDPLTTEFYKIKSEIESINDDHKALSIKINGILQSTTTTGRLVEMWPEIKPLIHKLVPIESSKRLVPVTTIKALNKELGLKPIEKAA